MESTLTKQRLFTNKDLYKLFLPLIIEQLLGYLVGFADSIMVASVGETAVSGVSLVDFIMALLISIFAALATGGAVIAGQYLGNKQESNARTSANQIVWFSGVCGLVIMALVYIFKDVILHGLFGSIDPDVYTHANTYLLIVASSIPFLAVYHAGAGIFRTMGNSKLPMKIMLTMNILNVTGNALLVYGFKLGTAGIAVPTLFSRIGVALIIVYFACNPQNVLHLKKSFRHKFDMAMVKQILGIGIPFGLENGMFHFGRLLILSLVSTFGTSAISANSVGGTIVMFQALPGMAIGLGLTVIISRCIGAQDHEQARYYTKKIMAIIYVSQIITVTAILLLLPTILNVYNLSPESVVWTKQIVWSHGIGLILIWPLANTLPITFRASGDAKFPMVVSMISMIFCRIVLAYVFVKVFNMDMFATWIAMYFDWIVKAIIFVWRYLGNKWERYHAIK